MSGHPPGRNLSVKHLAWIVVILPLAAACEEPKVPPAPVPPAPAPAPKPWEGPAVKPPAGEPEHITVQHILVGFTGSVGKKDIRRTRDEAAALAQKILELARTGVSMDELMAQYGTDDSPPGIYGLSNRGVEPKPGNSKRDGMVPAFGNVGFKLAVDEVGLAPHHETDSPYGWHIIKRVK
jgi:hypothetical protein